MPLIEYLRALSSGIIKYDDDLMKKYGKYAGVGLSSQHIIYSTDVDFIKSILIKDFNSFVNRNSSFVEAILIEPIDKMMVFLKDDEWRTVRTMLSPTFTTGKLKFVIFLEYESVYRFTYFFY